MLVLGPDRAVQHHRGREDRPVVEVAADETGFGIEPRHLVGLFCDREDHCFECIKYNLRLRSSLATLATSGVQIPDALRTVPAIVVNGYALDEPDFPTIDPNDILGGEIAGRALIDAGHREIALLGGGTDDTTREREIGFRRAMASAPGSPAHYRFIAGEYSIRSGYLRMRAILEEAQWIPTAVFAINDRAALGAIQAITEAGYRVPEDISVIGYDDEPFLASDIHPALTTVLLPHYEMGQLGVLALLEHPGERPPPGRRDATPRLILRDSLAPPRPVL